MTAETTIFAAETQPLGQSTALPDVHTHFWPNPDFDLNIPERGGFMGNPRLPLTALRGPHSLHIARALSKHDALSEFAHGVDERAVYDDTDAPWGFDFADWDSELDDKPLAFAFYRAEDNIHHVVCLRAKAVGVDHHTEDYEFSVSGILIINHKGEIFGFADTEEPLEMRFSPTNRKLMLDVIRFWERNFHFPDQLIERLVFTANAFSEIETYLDPTK